MKNFLLWPQNFAGRRVASMLMVMKLTALLLVAFTFQVTAKVHSQDKVTLKVKNASLVSVLQEIRKQTGYLYSIMDQYSDKALKVNISVNQAPVEEVLPMLFKDQPFTYVIIEKTIVVKQKEVMATVASSDGAKIIKAEGEVMNSDGQPLSGASVTIKETRKSVLTNERGEFSFTSIPANAVLIITYIGYASKQVPVQDGERMRIMLSAADNTLDESVVIAYGNTTRRLNTGSVGTVKGEEIEKQPINNPLEAIEGRVPGLFIRQSSGQPGTNFTVQIRGQNSIANGNDPLYVIDGVPYSSQLLLDAIPSHTNGSPLNFINPYDIESIDVLKDADATAIYGSRGANGVILITTKKGKAGSTRVNINVNSGVGKVGHFMDLMNTQQYLQMRHEAFANDKSTPTIANAPDLLLWDTTRYTNWQKTLIGGSAHYTDAQVSVSGGSANTQYLIGGSYHRQTTVSPGNFADQKGTAHFSLTSSSNNQKFKLLISGSYVLDNANLPVTDMTGLIPALAPDAPPIYNTDGTLNWQPNASGSSTWSNPLANLVLNYKGITNNLVTNSAMSYQLLKGLDLRVTAGYTNMDIKETSVTPIAYYSPSAHVTSGNNYFANSNIHSWILEPQVDYRINEKWGGLSTLVGATFLHNYSNSQNVYATGFSSDALLYDMLAATSLQAGAPTNAIYKYNALFMRINYNWDEKYMVNVTARRDGSSRFGPDKQFHNFGAAGVAWVFSKEKVIQDHLTFISFGKLRASYGITGNDQIGDYKFLDLYRSGFYPYQNVSTLYTQNLYNPDFAWETNKKLEGGMELGFIKDRILLTASYFRNRSSNQLVGFPLPAITGFTSITENLPATVQNKGWEFLLTTTNIKNRSFKWTSSFNITIHRNALVAYSNLETSSYSNSLVIGQPLNIIKAYHSTGVNDSAGIYQFASKTNTFSPNSLADKTVLINVNPKYYGGFLNSFQYRGLQLEVFLQFVKQTSRNILYVYSSNAPGFEGYNEPAALINNWKKSGYQSNFQRFTQASGMVSTAYGNYLNQSDLIYTDGSYIRVKNVSLSYQIPNKWSQKVQFQTCRIYLHAENLWTLTHHYQGIDPETQSTTSLPLLRTITGGFQVVF